MRYGDARQVAALLNDMFVGGNGADSIHQPISLALGAECRHNQRSRECPRSAIGTSSAQTPPTGQTQSNVKQPSTFDARVRGPARCRSINLGGRRRGSSRGTNSTPVRARRGRFCQTSESRRTPSTNEPADLRQPGELQHHQARTVADRSTARSRSRSTQRSPRSRSKTTSNTVFSFLEEFKWAKQRFRAQHCGKQPSTF